MTRQGTVSKLFWRQRQAGTEIITKSLLLTFCLVHRNLLIMTENGHKHCVFVGARHQDITRHLKINHINALEILAAARTGRRFANFLQFPLHKTFKKPCRAVASAFIAKNAYHAHVFFFE